MAGRKLHWASMICLPALVAVIGFAARATVTGKEYSVRALGWRYGVQVGGTVPVSVAMVSGSRVEPADTEVPWHKIRINGRRIYHDRTGGAGLELIHGKTSLTTPSGPVVMQYWTFQIPLFYVALLLLTLPSWWIARIALRRTAQRQDARRGFEARLIETHWAGKGGPPLISGGQTGA